MFGLWFINIQAAPTKIKTAEFLKKHFRLGLPNIKHQAR